MENNPFEVVFVQSSDKINEIFRRMSLQGLFADDCFV